uniref:ARAD1C03586p n=1 Tax=Blastobotrys adeninivorans TaxID=409370 RepID=A0A060T579_BLAAD
MKSVWFTAILAIVIASLAFRRLATQSAAATMYPVYFFSHGGPTFMYSDNPQFASSGDIGAFNKIRDLGSHIVNDLKPKYILCVSAHWQPETGGPSSVHVAVPSKQPTQDQDIVANPLVYDFYGFPQFMYEEQFPSVASHALANSVVEKLKQAGLNGAVEERGIDHGVWVPFKVAFPKGLGDIPLLQVSLPQSDDFALSYKLGEALKPFREDGMVIVSGMSVHNLRERGLPPQMLGYSELFNSKLTEILTKSVGDARLDGLQQLLSPEYIGLYRKAHPTPDHFLPVVVGAGLAGSENGTELYTKASGSLGWNIYKFE